MLKLFLEFLLRTLLRCLLATRYRIKVTGLETITNLPHRGGILFLANHPAEADPCILLTILWPRFRPRPVAIDYLFRKKFVSNLLRFVSALPVPAFEGSSNSFKRRKIEKVYEEIVTALKRGENFLIYPAGVLKHSGEEIIGGASGVHTLLTRCEEANVVLIRTEGLWGSSFSKASDGKTPDLARTFTHAFLSVLKNLIFFLPKRELKIECMAAREDFPWKADRITLNRYVEKWYNKNGIEPLQLISYAFWKEELLQVTQKEDERGGAALNIPQEIEQEVLTEIARITSRSPQEIKRQSSLALDLGLDSLDQAQLALFLKEKFGVNGLHPSDLEQVEDAMAYAAHLKSAPQEEDEEQDAACTWYEEKQRPPPLPPEGKSVIEAFLKTSCRMGNAIACTDPSGREPSYNELRQAVILFAGAIAKLPGENIGIMMPACTAVNVAIFATQLAGKVPVMINWTLGEHNINAIIEGAGIQTAISSERFLDKLSNVELNGLDDKFTLVEEMMKSFSLQDKLRALTLSKRSVEKILQHFGAKTSPQDLSVILFTSGTEREPKGVPLTNENILSNEQDAFQSVEIKQEDVLLGVLPPFHSFGFSVTGLLPLLCGVRVVFLPNPTDGRKMANYVQRWGVTILCLAPTFLKTLLRVASTEQLSSVRLIVSGAERMPGEVAEKIRQLLPQTKVAEGYGITECAPILTINPPREKSAGVGRPLSHVELLLVHPETLRPVAPLEEGHVLARGPNVFAGYLNPHLPSPFIEVEGKRWYKTGDLGFLDVQGYLTLSGRLKRFVKIGGEMVSLGLIEETLLRFVNSAKGESETPPLAVVAKEDEGKRAQIVLFISFPLTLQEANDELKKAGVSNLARLTHVKQVPFIPLLGSGKVDYRALQEKVKSYE